MFQNIPPQLQQNCHLGGDNMNTRRISAIVKYNGTDISADIGYSLHASTVCFAMGRFEVRLAVFVRKLRRFAW